jgi:hypothetical protein
MAIADDVHGAGAEILSAPTHERAAALNGALTRFIGEHFLAVPGTLVDLDGNHLPSRRIRNGSADFGG